MQAARDRRQAPQKCSRIASHSAEAIAGEPVVQIIGRPSGIKPVAQAMFDVGAACVMAAH